MKIAVNTRLLLKNRLEGIGWFTYETMKRIAQWHPEHEFFFLFDRPYDPKFIFSNNITPVVLYPQSRHPILWYLWFEVSVKRFLKSNSIDLFISPDGYMSLSSDVPQLGIIHDINFFHYPNDLPPFARLYLNYYFPRFASKAIRIATVSEYSKSDISKSYGIDPDKIDVVYNGANDQYKQLSDIEKGEVRSLISDGHPYFVFVGAFNPRKNVARLLLAFEKFKTETNSPFRLVIVGEKMYSTRQMNQVFSNMKYRDDVVFAGRLQVEQLKRVIGAAFAMAYFSYFEGFGIPILEAMKCGVPLIASNLTSIPEVAGNAALYANPFNVDSMTDAMMKISSNEKLRERLIENALLQQKMFSWDNTAKALYESIVKIKV